MNVTLRLNYYKNYWKKHTKVHEVQNVRNNSIVVNNVLCDRGIKEMIRIIEMSKIVVKICPYKFRNNSNIVDLQVKSSSMGY